MVKYFAHHTIAFLILTLLMGLHVVFYLTLHDPFSQFLIIVSAAVSYVTWGLVHHTIGRTLTKRAIGEYVMIATLGLVIGFSLLAAR